MRFLRSASQSSISQAKLRQFLVLLFRVLAVLALIVFLARPLAGGWLGWALSPAPEVIILVLDRSPSMESEARASGKSRREQAITLWSDALKTFQGASRFVLVDNSGKKAREIPSLGMLREAEFTAPIDRTADLPSMLQSAYHYLVDSRSGAAEVWIASDLQESAWKPSDDQWKKIVQEFNAIPQKVRFRLLTFKPPTRDNVSIQLVDAVRRTRNQQSMLEVTLDLRHDPAANKPLVLKCKINGAESQTTIDLEGQSFRWRGAFPVGNATAAGSGSFELPSDGNPGDNQVYFAYEPERSASALVVSAEPNAGRPLSFACANLNQENLSPARIVPPGEFTAVSLTNTALIAWDAPLPSGVSSDLLEEFANSGGEIVFFPPARGPSGGVVAGMSWGESIPAGTNKLFHVAKWNELDGPLAKTEEGLGMPLPQLEVYQRAAISGEGAILASFTDSAPFLVRKVAGKGEFFFCGTSPDPAWSSLSDGPVLVPMMQRLLAAGSRRINAASTMTCDELANRVVTGWLGLKGEKDPRLHSGIYREGGRLVAVNRSASEDVLDRLPPQIAAKLFGNLNFQFHQDESKGGDRLQGEVWRMFLFCMLIFLIVEGLLVMPPRHAEENPDVPLQHANEAAGVKS
jgi:hypothetical protein